MDVEGWLRRLGLEQYEASFRENKIDDTVLPKLTAEDLKDLGVGPVGDRRKLLDAIVALCAEASAPTPSLTDAPLAIERAVKDTAERRQVTVMFSDLVGSTALSARLDPEDLREVISAYQRCVAETARHFGGFVARFMGDGVLIYFGYPTAHEDDAERAVRFGLALIGAVATLPAPEPLQVRIGAATGTVVVGDLIRSGEAQEHDIVGETPNLAARLQAIAEPNTVVIAETTRRLLGNLFELRDLGLKELKGIAGPIRVFAALRASSVESRFEAMHPGGLTDLVGREEELDLLMRRWSKAKSGEGRVVLLSGEAGIGKSRLTAALLDRLASEPHTRLRYFCSPQYTDSALHPIINQMERAAGFTWDDTSQTKLNRLDRLLAQSPTSGDDAALFAEMLSLPNDGRYPTLDLAPQQRRQRTLEALTAQIEAFARRNPVLMIFEDAHWADPTSLEAFGRAVDRIKALDVLLIITYRPEFEPPWTGQPHVTTLVLNRLGQREIVAMIDRVTGNKPLLASIRQDIIERTDGIPLFIEEMTKAVLETGGQEGVERAVSSTPAPSLAVPASLHASLMARLDHLGPAKEVAQVGAAIGRDFSHALLAAVMPKSEAELNFALDRIIAAGLLFRQGNPPFTTYLFKHALVQDAAYGTLLREPRRALHARIVQTIENQFAEITERQPELLAHHCTEAGLIERGALLWGKAGQRALEQSAFAEAAGQLRRALDQIATLPATPALRREQINFQVAHSNSLFNVKGFGPETRAALEQASLLIEQAVALGEPLEDPLLLFVVLYSSWYANLMAANSDVCRVLAERTLALAEKQNALVPLIVGHNLMAGALSLVGAPAQGREHCDHALALYDPVEHRSVAIRFGMDLRVATLLRRSLILQDMGYPVAAIADAEDALGSARATGHAATLLGALVVVEKVYLRSGNYTAANAALNELAALADEKGAPAYKTAVNTGRGRLLAFTGKPAEAVQLLTFGLADAAQRSTGKTYYLPFNLSCLARAHAELGQFDEALHRMDEAKTAMEATGEKWCEAAVYLTAGEIELKLPEPDAAKAEAHFERALTVARQQQAKSWELVAATSMARLWRDQGKPQPARELLAPVYGWFAEGFDTPDLREAKALLEELAR